MNGLSRNFHNFKEIGSREKCCSEMNTHFEELNVIIQILFSCKTITIVIRWQSVL